mgnify:CR=1 FL=1
MKIKIKKLSEKDILNQKIYSWPIWSCDISDFEWEYDAEECCLLLEGQVQVITDFEMVSLSAGDFVIFPKGLRCRWKVVKPVRKHYSFN